MGTFYAAYEVLSQPLIPKNTAVPYITQGCFVQITNTISNSPLIYTIKFIGTPALQANVDGIDLVIDYIDQNGNPNFPSVPAFINLRRTLQISIGSGCSFIFGIQYILPDAIKLASGGTPQNSAAARGVVAISAPVSNLAPNQILVTTRQFFTNYDSSGRVVGSNGSAYVNPLDLG